MAEWEGTGLIKALGLPVKNKTFGLLKQKEVGVKFQMEPGVNSGLM